MFRFTVHYRQNKCPQVQGEAKFALHMQCESEPHLSASSMGSRFKSAVSLGSLNQDLIGIALSVKANSAHRK